MAGDAVLKKNDLAERLDEFLTAVRSEDELTKRTLDKYRRDIQKLIDYLDPADELTKAKMLDYRDYLVAAGYEKSSINSFVVVANKYLCWLGSPDLCVGQLKIQSTSFDDAISPVDYERLLRRAKLIGQQDTYMAMKIFGNTGIRISELRYFTVENLERCTNHKKAIRVTNKGKTRDVPIRQESVSYTHLNRRKYENRMEKFIKCSKIEVIKLCYLDLKLEKIKSPGIRSLVFIGADERNIRSLKNIKNFQK